MSNTPNEGTRNKREIMNHAETILSSLGRVTEDKAVGVLGYKLHVSTRTARETYLFQLIQVGIVLTYPDGTVEYITQNEDNTDDKILKDFENKALSDKKGKK